MTDPIETLAEIYPTLANGQKHAAREVKAAIEEMKVKIADLESTLARQPLPEAPASITVKVVDLDTQMEYLVTVREARAGLALIGRIPDISAALAGLGLVAIDAYIDGRRAERAAGGPNVGPNQQRSGTQRAESGAGEKAKNQPPADALTFKAENLTKSTEGDKTYYKVKGGKFAQYGVTIWPEALAEAGFDLDTLAGVTSLTGYTAYYVLNDKGKPAKVVGLAKG